MNSYIVCTECLHLEEIFGLLTTNSGLTFGLLTRWNALRVTWKQPEESLHTFDSHKYSRNSVVSKLTINNEGFFNPATQSVGGPRNSRFRHWL